MEDFLKQYNETMEKVKSMREQAKFLNGFNQGGIGEMMCRLKAGDLETTADSMEANANMLKALCEGVSVLGGKGNV